MLVPRPNFDWRLHTISLPLGKRTLVMGVVNITPDSFSDGGRFQRFDHAMAQSLRMINEGVDIIDFGGESTRPGKKEPITPEMELDRILPVIQSLRWQCPDTILSVDTFHATTARAAVEAGVEIVNDISGLMWDEEMAATCAELECGVVLMHTRGRPEEWRTLPPLVDPVGTVRRGLMESTNKALAAGVDRSRIVLDPGFGFGKNFQENYPLLARFGELHELGYPLMAGTSRKSFLGRTLARDGIDAAPDHRLNATLASTTIAVLAGAHIVRVHDVEDCIEAVKVADAVRESAQK